MMLHTLPQTLIPLFDRAITDGIFPGAAIAVIKISTHRATSVFGVYGYTDYQKKTPVSINTCYDLASLTKPLATTLAIFSLIRDNTISLADTLPSLLNLPVKKKRMIEGRKNDITLAQLLNHSAGLPPHQPFYRELADVDIEKRNGWILREILDTPLGSNPGGEQQYSDIGFMLLGMIVEKKSGLSLSEYVGERIFTPLGIDEHLFFTSVQKLPPPPQGGGQGGGEFGRAVKLNHPTTNKNPGCQDLHEAPRPSIQFNPLGVSEESNSRATTTFPPTLTLPRQGGGEKGKSTSNNQNRIFAPTEKCPWRDKVLCGEVHDDNAWAMGGAAGHAGLFGNILGVEAIVRYLLDAVKDRTHHSHISNSDIQRAVTRQNTIGTWGLGFDTRSPSGSSSGKYLSPSSFGHLGYTGTSFWVDPERDLAIILLTNRVHPSRDNEQIKAFRPFFHDAVMENLQGHGREFYSRWTGR